MRLTLFLSDTENQCGYIVDQKGDEQADVHLSGMKFEASQIDGSINMLIEADITGNEDRGREDVVSAYIRLQDIPYLIAYLKAHLEVHDFELKKIQSEPKR